MTKFVDEAEVVGTAAAPRFVSDFEVTGVQPPPPTFLENLQGFLTDADSWKDMGRRAAQIGLGTGDLVLGLPGMLAGSAANLAGRTVGAVQGKSRKETEAKGLEYRAYIPEGFIAPLQTAAHSLGLPPLDQSGMEMVMNAAGGFVDKQTGGTISDQDAKDAIEMVFLRGGMYAQKSINSAVRGKIDAKYGPKQAATGDRRGEVTWEEEVEPQQQATPKTAPKTPEQVIAESKARIEKKRKDVRAAVKAETPEEKVARMAVKQLDEGEATWTSGGVDRPVRVNGPAEKGPDGQYYTPVKYGDNTSYVPTKELSPAKPPEPQVGLPNPVEVAPRTFLPDEAIPKTRLTEGKVLGEAVDPLETALDKAKAGQNFLLDSQERVALQDVQKAQGQIVVPQERVVPRPPYNSIIKPTPRRPLETGLAKLRSVSQLDSMDQAQLRSAPQNLLTLDERAALRATNAAGARIVGADGKPLGSSFTQDGAVDPKMLAALGITSAAVWAALRPEDMEKLAMMGVIGATAMSGEARSVGALVKEGAPYHFETMLKLPQGATLLGKQQVMDMAKKFPAEAPIVERVLAGAEGNKISAAELHQGLVEETAGWKLAAKETTQYNDYGLSNLQRQTPGPSNPYDPRPVAQPTTTLFRLPEHMQVSDANHFGDNRLFGWTRSFKEDGVTHVVELQSDLAQHTKELPAEEISTLRTKLVSLEAQEKAAQTAYESYLDVQTDQRVATNLQQDWLRAAARVSEVKAALAAGTASTTLSPIIKNWPRRLIRETLLKETQAKEPLIKAVQTAQQNLTKLHQQYAVEEAQFELETAPSIVRFASADTVAKVEGWPKRAGRWNPETSSYTPEHFESGHQSIYNRYAGEITRYLKGLGGKEYTDPQGHTWWEVPTDVAKQSYGPGIKMLGAADPEFLAKLGAGVALGAYLVANPDKVEMALGGLALGMAVKGGSKGILDADLLRHIQEGGAKAEGAAAELYRRHAPQMTRTLQGKFGKQNVDIEEAVQDGFFHSLKVVAKGHFRGDAEFSTYLHRAVVNRALNQLRSAASRPDTISLTEDPNTGRSALAETLGHDDTPANRLQARDLGAQIDKALSEINPDFRDAFLAVERDGMSYIEGAEARGIPINTFRTQVHRGKLALQAKLAEYERGPGLEQTPADYSVAPKPRMGDYERGAIDPALLKRLAATAGGAALAAYLAEPDEKLSAALLGAIGGFSLTTLGGQRVMQGLVEGAANTLGHISTELQNMSPALHHRHIKMELGELKRAHTELAVGDRFFAALERAKGNQLLRPFKDNPVKTVESALTRNDFAQVAIELRKLKMPELLTDWHQVRAQLERLGADGVSMGLFKEARTNYFPRTVKDFKGLQDVMTVKSRSALQKEIADAEHKAYKAGRGGLDDFEKSIIINDYLQRRGASSFLPSFAKGRRLTELSDEVLSFYNSPIDTYHSYIRKFVREASAAEFFGKDLKQMKKGSHHYTNYDASIGEIILKERAEGRLTEEQLESLRGIEKARFGGGNKPMWWFWQDVKNLTTAGLLGNMLAATAQYADIAPTVATYGFKPSLEAAIKMAKGTAQLRAGDLGLINHVAEEFVSTRPSARILNWAFTHSILGPKMTFAGADVVMKEHRINTALIAAQQEARAGGAKLAKDYAKAFGDDFPKLQHNMRTGAISPEVLQHSFHELSRTQPISKLEMSKWELENPNGRMLLSLKSWVRKQGDFIRRDSYNKIRKGEVKEGLTMLLKYGVALGIGGATMEQVRNWMLGRDEPLTASTVFENMAKTFALGRYTRDEIRKGNPVKALGALAIPPYQMFDEIVKRDQKIIRYLPDVGPLLYAHLGDGKIKFEVQKAKEAKARGEPVHLSPAAKAYLRQKKKERDAEKKGRS